MSSFSIVFAQDLSINGRLRLENEADRDSVFQYTRIVIQREDHRWETGLNDSLEFEFIGLEEGRYTLMLFPEDVTGKISSYRFYLDEETNEHTFLEIPYALTCKYDKSIGDKTCPICQKQDRVIPIVYGLAIEVGDPEPYKPGGCMISNCDPNWHCTRNDIDF